MRPTDTERVDDTVRRPAHERSAFVADLLAHLRRRGFDGAPLALGFDVRGRQIFEWIPGDVPESSPFRLTAAQQVACAVLVRRFHDAAASFAGLGGAETVEHGDLGPHNIVFRLGSPVAIIDWDAAVGPGSRASDFAHAAWCCADLFEEDVDLEVQRGGLHRMCAAYDGIAPAVVLAELEGRFLRARSDHAAHGRPAAVAVFDDLLRRIARDRPSLLDATDGVRRR